MEFRYLGSIPVPMLSDGGNEGFAPVITPFIQNDSRRPADPYGVEEVHAFAGRGKAFP